MFGSENGLEDLPFQRRRRNLGRFGVFDARDARREVHIDRLPRLCALVELPVEEQAYEYGEIDIFENETGSCVGVQKYGKK